MEKKLLFLLFLIPLILFNCSSDEEEYEAPENLEVSKLEEGKLKLTWDYTSQSSDITFTIARKSGDGAWVNEYVTTEDDDEVYIDEVETNTYDVYSYKVSANDNETETSTAYSPPIAWFSNFTKPTNLEVTQIDQNSLQLQWEDNANGETGYKVDKKNGTDDWEVGYAVLTENTSTFIDTAFVLYDEVSYRAYAFVNESRSERIETTFLPTFAAPSELEIEQLSQSQIRLNWIDNSEGEEGFEIARKIGNGGEWNTIEKINQENSTEYVDIISIDAGTIYYKIRAYNDTLYSYFTEIKSINFNLQKIGSLALTSASDISIYGNYAYIASGFNGVEIIDISNQENPQNVGSITSIDGKITAVHTEGELLFVTNQNGGLTIFDLINPTAPIEGAYIDFDPLEAQSHDIITAYYDDYFFAFVAGGDAGLIAVEIDLLDVESSNIASIYNTHGNAYSLLKINNYVYVADESDGVKKIDVSDPHNISYNDDVLVEENPFINGALSITNFNNNIFVGCGVNGIRVLNPVSLNEIAYYHTQGYVNNLEVSNHFAYLADDHQGLTIVDIQDINNIYEIGHIDTESDAKSIKIKNSYAYIISENNLDIIQIVP